MHLGAELRAHAELALNAWKLLFDAIHFKFVASGTTTSEHIDTVATSKGANQVFAVVHKLDQLLAHRQNASS